MKTKPIITPNPKRDQYWMDVAQLTAKQSHGIRAKVGSVLVTENGASVVGCNGLPKQLGNDLEYRVCDPAGEYEDSDGKYKLVTRNEVTHAELNTVLKCAKEGISTVGSTIYVTLSPCSACATMLVAAGVKRVVYLNEYRDTQGLYLLKQCGVIVDRLLKTTDGR